MESQAGKRDKLGLVEVLCGAGKGGSSHGESIGMFIVDNF